MLQCSEHREAPGFTDSIATGNYCTIHNDNPTTFVGRSRPSFPAPCSPRPWSSTAVGTCWAAWLPPSQRSSSTGSTWSPCGASRSTSPAPVRGQPPCAAPSPRPRPAARPFGLFSPRFPPPVMRNKLKYAAFLRKRTNTNPKRGPIHYRSPSRILWRTVRGMLPHKLARGQAALGRLKVRHRSLAARLGRQSPRSPDFTGGCARRCSRACPRLTTSRSAWWCRRRCA